jgi:hypothetical protein
MTHQFVLAALLGMTMPGFALAAHPFISDDAETQGRGGFQLGVNAERGVAQQDDTRSQLWNSTLTYGGEQSAGRGS